MFWSAAQSQKTKTVLVAFAIGATYAASIMVAYDMGRKAGTSVPQPQVQATTPENVVILPNPDDKAKEALIIYLNALHDGDYAKAIPLYGGEYATMRDWNPDTAPTNLMQLWKRACEQNGLNCLAVRNIDLVKRDGDDFTANVWFTNRDGFSEFSRGPCCGSESDAPPQSVFPFIIHRFGDADYRVMTLPPYTP